MRLIAAAGVLVLGAPATQVAEGDKYFEFCGFAMLDCIQDFDRVNPDWEDTLRPSRIPVQNPEEALRVYTRQCSIGINTRELAIMGATLANLGVNPLTKKIMMPAEDVPELLAVMATAGFYDESGEWMYTAGLPAKTGMGGGIVAVVPGRFAIAAFSPRLNEAGNSVRALNAIRDIAGQLGVGVFGPNPAE